MFYYLYIHSEVFNTLIILQNALKFKKLGAKVPSRLYYPKTQPADPDFRANTMISLRFSRFFGPKTTQNTQNTAP